jgi:integrase
MNIWYQPSRAKKGLKKNTKQAFLRWYEGKKTLTKKLDGLFLYTSRNLNDQQRLHNKKAKLDLEDVLNRMKQGNARDRFNIDSWDRKARSFVEYGKEWIKQQDFSYVSKKTYSQALKLFEGYFGKHKQCHTISKADIINFKVDLRENGKSRYSERYELSTINTYINRLKLIYASAQAKDDILTKENYFKTDGYVKVDTDVKKEYINTKEYAQLDYTKCRNEAVAKAFMFGIQTGLRKEDIEKQTWGDLKKDEKGLHIFTIQKKTGKKVRVAIGKIARELLGERKPDHAKLIPFSLTGLNRDYLKLWLAQTFPKKAVGEQRGRNGTVGLTFHSSRASFITNMLMSGIAPTRVQTYAGHSLLSTTLGYYRGSTEMQEEDMDKMDNIYQGGANLNTAKNIIQ